MRIPSGKTDQLVFFLAVDLNDLVTRKTGLTTFTVYRSRNGGTATLYTTPTVAELSTANMPGVYSLVIDEDTTIASTSDSEEYCVHITQASMAPVTRTIELYRRDTTSGNTALVDANGRVDVIKVAGTTQAAGDIPTLVTAVKTKTDFLPSVTAGAAGGLFIAGANAATSITTALTANVIGNVTGNLSGSVGSLTTNNDKTGYALTAGERNSIADATKARQITAAVATDGSAPTIEQALFLIQQMLTEFAIVGTTLTVNSVDGTTAIATMTLNSATAPTALTRAS